MIKIAGRNNEINELERYYKSNKAEFIVVYGRRRVGKTYLINKFFDNNFFFHITGKYNTKKSVQIKNFITELGFNNKSVSSWDDAFNMLRHKIEQSPKDIKKVIYIDEISWFDKTGSSFISEFEYFWNHFCNSRDDILLIICSSSSSWITKHIFKNKGGLYNRITGKLLIEPFSLKDTKEYFNEKNIILSNKQILDLYIVFGGIPYYLDYFNHRYLVTQNINKILFSPSSPLKNEYDDIFSSLFTNDIKYKTIVDTLSIKNSGLTRNEIIELSKIPDNGELSTMLKDLELSGFIRKYQKYPNKKKESIYQLIDNFSLFYNKVIKKSDTNDNEYWTHTINTGKYYAWRGYSFENVCLNHIDSIKRCLGISGILTNYYAHRSNNSQIDLLIHRIDNTINLCVGKYTDSEFTITKEDYENFDNKVRSLYGEIKERRNIVFTLISVFDVKENDYSNIASSLITLYDLFK
jgi:AAA+ ATPase superfamily predicted ATPase